jgi:hypothetical protein
MQRSIIADPPKHIILKGRLKFPWIGVSYCIITGRHDICDHECPIELINDELENGSMREIEELFSVISLESPA